MRKLKKEKKTGGKKIYEVPIENIFGHNKI